MGLDPDAVVIGAGHNGLVAANLLADAGWSVVVLEAQPHPGGAVRTAELTVPGFRHDVFSAFYPMGAASPVLEKLDLASYGLRWRHAPLALAHPTPDGRCVVLSTDLDETARSLDDYAGGDGDVWRRFYDLWQRAGSNLLQALFLPLPALKPIARIAASLGPRGVARLGRLALLPVRRLGEESFSGEGGTLLFAGNALHTDLSPESAGSTLFGWLLASAGQEHGFPVPEGGAGELIAALVRRLESRGGRIECNTPVAKVIVRDGRAVAVRTLAGDEVGAGRAVLADVGAPALYLDLIGEDLLPAEVVDDIRRFHYDQPSFKVDWALDGPVPWKAEPARQAATVHIADGLDEMSEYTFHLSTGRVPARPFILFGQQTVADPTRCPQGSHTAWAYTHVPRRVRGDAGGDLTGSWDEKETQAFAGRIQSRIERLAPGFGDLVRGRHILSPRDLHNADANLVDGAVNGGTAQLHQQLLLRPTPGLGLPTTPIKGLYLASASAHPGGGVHGACGANAARAALAAYRLRRPLVAAGLLRR